MKVSYFFKYFRTLLPKWKFFDNFGHTPLLYFRIKDAKTKEFTPWENVIVAEPRSFAQLFINPHTNLNHYYITLINQAIYELNEKESLPDGFTESELYLQIKNITAQNINKDQVFQFKIGVEKLNGNFEMIQEDLLVSAEHQL